VQRNWSRRRPGRVALLLAALLAAVLVAVMPAGADPKFPPLTGRIVDEAGLLSVEDKRAIEQVLAALEGKSTDQLVVYTTRSLQGYPIEDFGYRLGRFWQIGQKGANNGVVLIVAPNERKVRIEVGRGLEPQLTDLMSKLIVENAILPAFRRNDFAGGIKAGVRDIRDVLLGDAEAVKQRHIFVVRPKRVGPDVRDINRFPAEGRRAARTGARANGRAVNGIQIFRGQRRRGTMPDMNSIGVEQQNRAEHARGLVLDQSHDGVEHLGLGRALSDALQDLPLSLEQRVHLP